MPLDPFLNQSQDHGGPQMPSLKTGQWLFNRRYELLSPLGAGGMGVVWLARDHTEETQVALKFLPSVLVLQPGEMKRLREEVRAGKELRHPRIVGTYGMEVEDATAAIVMEYVAGETLKEKLEARESGFFEADEIASWVKDICEGLGYLHTEARRIHRDIKPANIIVDTAGRARLMDFGISRRIQEYATKHSKTGEGQPDGGSSSTLAYASPQQISGKPAHRLDDIYSLGATVYELLTGTPPFFRGDAELVRGQIKHEPVTAMMQRRQELVEEGLNRTCGRPIPKAAERIVEACLGKEREARPDDYDRFHPALCGKDEAPQPESKTPPPVMSREQILRAFREPPFRPNQFTHPLATKPDRIPIHRVPARQEVEGSFLFPYRLGRGAFILRYSAISVVCVLIMLLANGFPSSAGTPSAAAAPGPGNILILPLMFGAFIMCYWGLMLPRIRDTGCSPHRGWLLFVPLVNIGFLIWLMVAPTDSSLE